MKLSLGKWLLPTYVALAFTYLMIPIGYTFVFSFNKVEKSNIAWREFTFDNWLKMCDQPMVCEAFANSVSIALISTAVSTALGTAIAIALGRYKFKGRSATNLLLFLPMATPEVVMGAGLAAQFLDLGISKGYWTIVVAHVMFTLSFVVVTVKARVATLDPKLEEAGRDLYANANQVFWRITFPLLLPGIMAAAMLSFALSFDDFIITQFNSGPETTFPKFVYTAAARGIPPEANVIGMLVFFVAIAIVMLVQIRSSLKAKALKN